MTHEQMSVIEVFISGRDVFVCLPTGFGKSLIFASLPIIFNKIIKKSSLSSSFWKESTKIFSF